ncbi:hypothetical protein AGMMS50230_17790 [Spirochaetia bacterium]|nr:hypothetical protein AGMMS50230_17790 [Spirochaetia bacterium]
MRKLVLILIAFFAVVTFIRAFAGAENGGPLGQTAAGAVELRETN